MDAAGMRSPGTSASARRGRRDPMGHNPVTPMAMGPNRRSSTENRATTSRRPSCTDQPITDREFIMVQAGVGEDVGGGKECVRSRVAAPQHLPLALPNRTAVGATLVV